jgi:hypothetical protein
MPLFPLFFAYDLVVVTRNKEVLCLFPLFSLRRGAVRNLVERKLSPYTHTEATFPWAVRVFVFINGQIELFTYTKM